MLLDISVPTIVPDDLRRSRPNVRARGVGFCPLPADPAVRAGGLLRPGTVFACAAEGLLLALEPALAASLAPDALIGAIDPQVVERLGEAGRRWGLIPSG